MKSINPTTELTPGTRVGSGSKTGTVVSVRHSKDQFGGPINVHTIHFTKQYTHRCGNIRKYKTINQVMEINYAGIYVIED